MESFFSEKEAIWQFFFCHSGVVRWFSSFRQDDKTSAVRPATHAARKPLFLIYTVHFFQRGAKVDRYSSYPSCARGGVSLLGVCRKRRFSAAFWDVCRLSAELSLFCSGTVEGFIPTDFAGTFCWGDRDVCDTPLRRGAVFLMETFFKLTFKKNFGG